MAPPPAGVDQQAAGDRINQHTESDHPQEKAEGKAEQKPQNDSEHQPQLRHKTWKARPKRCVSNDTLQKNSLMTPTQRYELSKSLPIPERQALIVKTYVENFKFFLQNEGKCLKCCFLHEYCICGEMEKLARGPAELCPVEQGEEKDVATSDTEEPGGEGIVQIAKSSTAPATAVPSRGPPPVVSIPNISSASASTFPTRVSTSTPRTTAPASPTTTSTCSTSESDPSLSRKQENETRNDQQDNHYIQLQPRFLLWMHYKEQFRASNTGKLLCQLFDNSETFVHGHPVEMERFEKKVRESKLKTLVLFPTENAVDADKLTMGDLRASVCDHVGQKPQQAQAEPEAPVTTGSDHAHAQSATQTTAADHLSQDFLNIVVLDGTWTQARKLLKSIFPKNKTQKQASEEDRSVRTEDDATTVVEATTGDHVDTSSRMSTTNSKFLFVKINPQELSRFCCRRQTQPDRICTAEAAAMLLQELKCEKKAVDNVYKGLKILCTSMDKQSHKDTMKYVAPTKNHVGRNRMQKNVFGKQAFV